MALRSAQPETPQGNQVVKGCNAQEKDLSGRRILGNASSKLNEFLFSKTSKGLECVNDEGYDLWHLHSLLELRLPLSFFLSEHISKG